MEKREKIKMEGKRHKTKVNIYRQREKKKAITC